MKDVAAILLAAGRSRRMGAFKPLLPFGNSTVIESCVTSFRSAGLEDIIVIVGHRAEAVRAQLNRFPIKFGLNPDPDSEMSVSIARGMDLVPDDTKAVLISPADHPAIPAEIIELLIDEWRRTGAKLIQPEHAGRGGHPVLIDLSCRDELMHLDRQTGLRGVFDRHRQDVRRLPVSSPFIARDMDTWEDYTNLHFSVFGRKPEEIDACDAG